MIYIDTSSLVKLIFAEEFSNDVFLSIGAEQTIVVSEVTRLEASVQLRARRLAGLYGDSKFERAAFKLNSLLSNLPFQSEAVSPRLFQIAIQQHDRSKVHCRSLDRLHLAAMEELGIRRLMTHDVRQAEAAREMGIDVVMPGVR